MRKGIYFITCMFVAQVALGADAGLDGRRIAVSGGTGLVSVLYVGEDPGKTIVVKHGATGAETRAEIIGGALTFVASASGEYTVDVLRRKKAPAVVIEQRGDDAVLDVKIDGELLTTFYYGDDLRKPYLWPLMTKGGVSITRDYPMGEPDKTRDHPHHTSMWTAYGDLNGADYWENGERTGWQSVENVEWEIGDVFGWIKADIVWQDKERKPVIQERRIYIFYNTPESARLIDVAIGLTADYGDVKFGDTKEGGMVGLRMADALREKGGTGTITNSEGGVGAKETWGKPAAWCDYSGTLDGVGAVGITVMDHPRSFRYPTHWHVRDYGLMGANAFGYSYFYNGEKNGDYLLKSGETMDFSYRLYLHAGDVKEAKVAEVYAAFVKAPTARWAN